jgi:hypothetical protein
MTNCKKPLEDKTPCGCEDCWECIYKEAKP